MLIIVESGATKTAWRAVGEDGSVREVQTEGLSPTCLDREHTQTIVRKAIPELNPEGKTVKTIHFYGAGLVSRESATPITEALEMWCPFASVEYHSDILAAARALWGNGAAFISEDISSRTDVPDDLSVFKKAAVRAGTHNRYDSAAVSP